MKANNPTPLARIYSSVTRFLKTVHASFPQDSTFVGAESKPAYHIFLNGRTVLVERSRKASVHLPTKPADCS